MPPNFGTNIDGFGGPIVKVIPEPKASSITIEETVNKTPYHPHRSIYPLSNKNS